MKPLQFKLSKRTVKYQYTKLKLTRYVSNVIRLWNGQTYRYSIISSKNYRARTGGCRFCPSFRRGWFVEREFLKDAYDVRSVSKVQVCAWAPTLSCAEIYAQAIDNVFTEYEILVEDDE